MTNRLLGRVPVSVNGPTLKSCIRFNKHFKSTYSQSTQFEDIYDQAKAHANAFDTHFHYKHKPLSILPGLRNLRSFIQPPPSAPVERDVVRKRIPKDPSTNQFMVPLPPYALSGRVNSQPMVLDLTPPPSITTDPTHYTIQQSDNPMIRNGYTIQKLRQAGMLARQILEYTCSLAVPGISTQDINTSVHDAIIASGAYPSPLNYAAFPKSVCTSINEVICHGIPDASHILQAGDLVKFDVSCFYQGVHGDNCATIVVGDSDDVAGSSAKARKKASSSPLSSSHSRGSLSLYPQFVHADWRDIPYKLNFASKQEELLFITARRLSMATYEALYAAISTCHPGSCLTDIGNAIAAVADAYGYDSVRKYRGHGISREFHIPPFVKHYRNQDYLELQPGMVFTIEPMLTEGHWECEEWESDQWTVVTCDGGRAAQFEHMVLISEEGVDILTSLDNIKK